jgi:hypothetical protein
MATKVCVLGEPIVNNNNMWCWLFFLSYLYIIVWNNLQWNSVELFSKDKKINLHSYLVLSMASVPTFRAQITSGPDMLSIPTWDAVQECTLYTLLFYLSYPYFSVWKDPPTYPSIPSTNSHVSAPCPPRFLAYTSMNSNPVGPVAGGPARNQPSIHRTVVMRNLQG